MNTIQLILLLFALAGTPTYDNQQHVNVENQFQAGIIANAIPLQPAIDSVSIPGIMDAYTDGDAWLSHGSQPLMYNSNNNCYYYRLHGKTIWMKGESMHIVNP